MRTKAAPRHTQEISDAVVSLPTMGGQGVLVPGNLILTAAHVLDCKTTGDLVLGDVHLERVVTPTGQELTVMVLAVEPITDIAVLGPLDGQECPDDYQKFESWCEQVVPVPILAQAPDVFSPFPVSIYTHRRTWIRGRAQLCHRDANCFSVSATEQVEGGTSGGPIITERGELAGIVSHSSDGASGQKNHKCDGVNPWPYRALPVWVRDLILRAQAG
jgi:hypothetical protein